MGRRNGEYIELVSVSWHIFEDLNISPSPQSLPRFPICKYCIMKEGRKANMRPLGSRVEITFTMPREGIREAEKSFARGVESL